MVQQWLLTQILKVEKVIFLRIWEVEKRTVTISKWRSKKVFASWKLLSNPEWICSYWKAIKLWNSILKGKWKLSSDLWSRFGLFWALIYFLVREVETHPKIRSKEQIARIEFIACGLIQSTNVVLIRIWESNWTGSIFNISVFLLSGI